MVRVSRTKESWEKWNWGRSFIESRYDFPFNESRQEGCDGEELGIARWRSGLEGTLDFFFFLYDLVR